MLSRRLLSAVTAQSKAVKLLAARKPLGVVSMRSRWVFGEDARGPQVPVGAKAGHPQNPEYQTEDFPYAGTPSKGDKLIPEWRYRTSTAGRTYIDRCLTTLISAMFWFWLTYRMYYDYGMLFGHWYMPYLDEFTDEELGIPPDDAPDPEYWGSHPGHQPYAPKGTLHG